MRFGVILARVVMLAVTVGVCRWLTSTFGVWKAIGLWAGGMALVCVGTALWLDRQPPGQITFVNRIAGYVLPWGYQIGRGKLAPIVATSWLIWVLLGTGAALTIGGVPSGSTGAQAPSAESATSPTWVTVLLYLSWIVDGAVLARIASVSWIRQNPMPPSIVTASLVIGGLIAGSAAIKLFGKSAAATKLALIVAGGPPLVVGVGYGLFLLVALTLGRNARWN
jgi:hypothetical protein